MLRDKYAYVLKIMPMKYIKYFFITTEQIQKYNFKNGRSKLSGFTIGVLQEDFKLKLDNNFEVGLLEKADRLEYGEI